LGSAQSLARRRQLRLTGEEEDALIDGIVASGIKLNGLVDDLLDFERLDRGVIEPVRAPTDLGAMARRLVAEADYLAQHPARVIAAPIEVSVDAAKVERILENLLRNAARHTPPGTPVVIRVEQRESGVLLSVEDEGPGIPDELKDVVFQPFRQGRTARASQSGAGIGLSLVAKFAGVHAGAGRGGLADAGGGASGAPPLTRCPLGHPGLRTRPVGAGRCRACSTSLRSYPVEGASSVRMRRLLTAALPEPRSLVKRGNRWYRWMRRKYRVAILHRNAMERSDRVHGGR